MTSTTAAGVQALLILTDSVCVYTLDLVHEGVTSERAIAERVAERVGVTIDHAAEVLDGLVTIGFVDRTGAGEVANRGLADFSEHVDEAVDVLHALKRRGQGAHVQDCVDAMDAAWNGRSDDPRLRFAAAAFRASESGARFAARVASGTVGRVAAEAA